MLAPKVYIKQTGSVFWILGQFAEFPIRQFVHKYLNHGGNSQSIIIIQIFTQQIENILYRGRDKSRKLNHLENDRLQINF